MVVGKPAPLQHCLEASCATGGRAVRLTQHRLLLTDQHVADDGAVTSAAGRGEAEQDATAECLDELCLASGGVAEEQHVGPVTHAAQDRQRAGELLRADRHQH